MSVHPEYLRGMKTAVEIVSDFIDEKRYVREESVPDLMSIRDGLSLGVNMAEMEP